MLVWKLCKTQTKHRSLEVQVAKEAFATLIYIYKMKSELFIFCYCFPCLLKYHRQENLSSQSFLRSIENKADSSKPGENGTLIWSAQLHGWSCFSSCCWYSSPGEGRQAWNGLCHNFLLRHIKVYGDIFDFFPNSKFLSSELAELEIP